MRNRFKASLLCLVVLSLQSAVHAQSLQYPPKQNFLRADAANAGDDIPAFAKTVSGDVLYVFSSPLRLNQKSGLTILALTVLTTASIAWFDRDLDDDFSERDDFFIKPALGLAKIGEGYDWLVSDKYKVASLPVTILAGGLIFKDKKLIQTSRLMVESFLITGTITIIGKGLFGRARPYTDEGPFDFEWFKFNGKQERRSLPSGHVSSAFSIVTVLAKQYDSWWMEIPAYTVGVAVAFQRMESRSHWNADVILGGALGYCVGSTLVNRLKRLAKPTSVNPYILGNRVGLMIEF